MKSLINPNTIFKLLVDKPGKVKKKVLNLALSRLIPFNKPHKFSVENLDSCNSRIKIPYHKINLNHVKGIHATCLATGGELCSGIILMQHFTPDSYRIILTELHTKYFYQAKNHTYACATINPETIQQSKEKLESKSSTLFPMVAQLFDKDENLVCEVETIWQLKNWKHVKTKV